MKFASSQTIIRNADQIANELKKLQGHEKLDEGTDAIKEFHKNVKQ